MLPSPDRLPRHHWTRSCAVDNDTTLCDSINLDSPSPFNLPLPFFFSLARRLLISTNVSHDLYPLAHAEQVGRSLPERLPRPHLEVESRPADPLCPRRTRPRSPRFGAAITRGARIAQTTRWPDRTWGPGKLGRRARRRSDAWILGCLVTRCGGRRERVSVVTVHVLHVRIISSSTAHRAQSNSGCWIPPFLGSAVQRGLAWCRPRCSEDVGRKGHSSSSRAPTGLRPLHDSVTEWQPRRQQERSKIRGTAAVPSHLSEIHSRISSVRPLPRPTLQGARGKVQGSRRRRRRRPFRL